MLQGTACSQQIPSQHVGTSPGGVCTWVFGHLCRRASVPIAVRDPVAGDCRCPLGQAHTWLRFAIDPHSSNAHPGPSKKCFCICWFIFGNPHTTLFLERPYFPLFTNAEPVTRGDGALAQGHGARRSAVEPGGGPPALSVQLRRRPLRRAQ